MVLLQGWGQLLRLGPKAIEVYEEALDCKDLGMAVATATKVLEGTGVLDKRGLQATIDSALTRDFLKDTPVGVSTGAAT